jgi:hypothetical protein
MSAGGCVGCGDADGASPPSRSTAQDGTFTVDTAGPRPVTADAVARVALDHHVLLTELRPSDSGGLEQLFFSLTSTPAYDVLEVAA